MGNKPAPIRDLAVNRSTKVEPPSGYAATLQHLEHELDATTKDIFKGMRGQFAAMQEEINDLRNRMDKLPDRQDDPLCKYLDGHMLYLGSLIGTLDAEFYQHEDERQVRRVIYSVTRDAERHLDLIRTAVENLEV